MPVAVPVPVFESVFELEFVRVILTAVVIMQASVRVGCCASVVHPSFSSPAPAWPVLTLMLKAGV